MSSTADVNAANAAREVHRLQLDGFTVSFEWDGDGYEENNKLYTVTKESNDLEGKPQTLTYAQRVRWQFLIYIPTPGEYNP